MTGIADTEFWARELGHRAGAVNLVRIGENAVWHAPDEGVAFRIYRHAETGRTKALRELEASEVLSDAGVPAIRAACSIPVEIGGRTATIWEWVDADGKDVVPFEFARLISKAHAAWRRHGELYPDGGWDEFDPISKIEARMDAFPELHEAPILQERFADAKRTWSSFRSLYPLQVIHGDAHSGNAISTDGGLVLADFDETKVGPVEWDLVSAVVGHLRFGRSRQYLQDFADGMGACQDMLERARTLAPVKELSALTWLATRALESERLHAELRRRLGLSGEGQAAVWRAA